MLAKGAESLPAKVAHDYKALAKLYDAKNYRKGLKNAEKILVDHPDHPETIAMKALFELGLGEEAKAEVDAKTALMKSKMSSMFCWHTYGSVMKHKRSFAEAAKSFQNALKFEKDNLQLLRQTAALQVQIRNHESHVATRLQILKLKPNMINNWVAFAVAQHLKGDYEQLFKAISSIQNLRPSAELKPIETSHYFIYRVIACLDAQKYDKMYEELTKNKDKILDEDTWNELMFKCSSKLRKLEQAKKSIQFLIKKYPENLEYLKNYEQICGITHRELYKKIGTEFNSKIAKVYQLCTIEDKSEFKKEFASFIKAYYQKNLISLFTEIQVIYETTNHAKIIEEVFLETEASLKNNVYPDGTVAKFPSEYLWSLYLLAQHFSLNFETLKQAYEYINKAIEHTNTVTQFYIVKAEIEYKMHNNLESLKTINEARKTDLADRYMNNICIKYLLKNMKPNLAEQVLRLFMRDEASLYELQNQWYIIQAGKSYLKQRNFPAGLRHLHFVEKQFQDIEANQLDFHTYCIRKWTLKEYLEYINFNDNIFKDKKYVQAAGYAIPNLLEYEHFLLIQAQKPKEEPKEDEAKKKKKKKKAKQTNQQQDLTPAQLFRKKIDYFGKEYAQKIKANPIQEAFIYARNVTSAKYVNKGNVKQNKLYCKAFSNAIRVFIRLNKPMLAIRAHKKLLKTKSDPYLTLLSSIKVLSYLQSELKNDKIHETTRQFAKEHLAEVLCGAESIQDYYTAEIAKIPNTFNRSVRIAQIQLALKDQDTRQNLIQLYKNQVEEILKSESQTTTTLQVTFSLCHRLEFYGQFSDSLKQKLNERFGSETTYFTNWLEGIDKLPSSTWGIFWLSDYDIKREEEAEKLQLAQIKQSKHDAK